MRSHDRTIPADGMQRRCLLDDLPFAFESTLLFPEATLQNSIRGQYLRVVLINGQEKSENLTYNIVFFQLLNVSCSGRTMPDEYFHTLRVGLNFVLPLHNCYRWAMSQVSIVESRSCIKHTR